MPILTISRQMASYGDEIAEAIARKTGWELLTRETVLQRFFEPITSKNEYHLLKTSARAFRAESEKGPTYRTILEDSLKDFAADHSAVMIGFGSQVIFSANPDAVHLRIIAPEEIRIERVAELYRVSKENAARIVSTADKKHRRFVSTVFGVNSSDPELYDLILNTADLTVEACTATILSLLEQHHQSRQIQRQIQQQTETQPDRPNVISHENGKFLFKNKSEEEFAQILDMYQIDWVYEPRTFPIEWDAEGNVTLAFSPDFYLPRFNTYIELTTMSQKYVTQKNRKAKRLQELYPGVHVKIVYKKDFQSLIDRFQKN
ncbi:MAG: cytidylate kinase-like family protein [Clostridia bacterium]|nr:cytidylate kinase-like family protein [Clostridia bacterium]